MTKPIRNIVILGGGTAGWITAGVIAAKHLGATREAISVTLVESPSIQIIGVGEGTWPTLRTTLKNMGVSETAFFRACDASFKQGAKFAKWATGQEDDFYYHPLVLPQGFIHGNLVPHWEQSRGDISFADAVCPQSHLCEKGLAPKQITTPEYASVANYSYHLDAGKFSTFLKNHCTKKLAVHHVLADMVSVKSAENGDISAINTEQAGTIEGDLFIDCTGFRALLLGEHYGVPLRDCSSILFADTALAVQAPYESQEAPIASHTIATAQEAGWIWDIGLPTRRGVGHVFSSRYIEPAHAQRQLRDYLRPRVHNVEQLDVRKIPLSSGHRMRFWQNNVVAVGLSAGFLEPLEASAIVLVEISARMIADQLPSTRAAMDVVAKRFNDKFLYHWDRIIDFLKLHYCVSQRTDSEFWIDNRDPKSIPDSLQELLQLWRHQYPWQDDFSHKDEMFPAASYQYVLYGMGFQTHPSFHGMTERDMAFAEQQFKENKKITQKMLANLPSNRALINKIKEYGMQRM